MRVLTTSRPGLEPNQELTPNVNTLIKEYCRLHTQCAGKELTCCKCGEFSNNILHDWKSIQTHSVIVLKSSGILPNLFGFQID